jgi:signal peptidase I
MIKINKKIFVRYFSVTLRFLFVATLCLIFIHTFILEVGQINGRSMENNYFDNNIFLVNKFILLFRSPERGDVVQFLNKKDGLMLIKRIVGMPGEIIIIQTNKVFIVGADKKEIELPEPYLKPYTATFSVDGKPTEYKIGPNEYFMLGDNRRESIDSRWFGVVNRSNINGLATKSLLSHQ